MPRGRKKGSKNKNSLAKSVENGMENVELENEEENEPKERKKRELTGETCFNCLAGDDFCTVYTSETWCRNKIKEWMREHPDEVKDFKDYGDGGVQCKVPKSWMTLIRPKRKVEKSEEEKEKLRERIKMARESKK